MSQRTISVLIDEHGMVTNIMNIPPTVKVVVYSGVDQKQKIWVSPPTVKVVVYSGVDQEQNWVQEYINPSDVCPCTGERHKPDWTKLHHLDEDGDVGFYVQCTDCGGKGYVGDLNAFNALSDEICW